MSPNSFKISNGVLRDKQTNACSINNGRRFVIRRCKPGWYFMSTEKIHFVTGRLAESSLRKIVSQIAFAGGFEFSIQVLPITVAALLTPKWIAPRLRVPAHTTRIILPGYCEGDLTPILEMTNVPVEFGPKDLRKLPAFFGQKLSAADLSEFDIQIIAEINHAPRKKSGQHFDDRPPNETRRCRLD